MAPSCLDDDFDFQSSFYTNLGLAINLRASVRVLLYSFSGTELLRIGKRGAMYADRIRGRQKLASYISSG